MSHPDPRHDPENVRSEDSKFAPRSKHKALVSAKRKMFLAVTKKRLKTSPSYKEASRMSDIHKRMWDKK